jgi:hypothetical protein
MPYELQKAPVGRGMFVVSKDTGRRHSNKPLPKARAIMQMRALYANVADSAKRKR